MNTPSKGSGSEMAALTPSNKTDLADLKRTIDWRL